jgi:hypothetical protein
VIMFFVHPGGSTNPGASDVTTPRAAEDYGRGGHVYTHSKVRGNSKGDHSFTLSTFICKY